VAQSWFCDRLLQNRKDEVRTRAQHEIPAHKLNACATSTSMPCILCYSVT
jgi:hypothetical protein